VSDDAKGPSVHSSRPASFQIRWSSMCTVMSWGLWREASGSHP
jgi:hypothetical protein